MRLYLTLTLIICAATQFANAQSVPADLVFNQRPVKCEKKWVVFPAKQGDPHYGYGFIYFDEKAGFTFDFKGVFTVDNAGRYVVDTSATQNGIFKYRLSPDMPDVAIVPARRFAEMHLKPVPGWLSNYIYGYTDTTAHNYRMGYYYNVAGESAAALPYLEPIYKMKADYQNVAYELAFAYNALQQGANAIKVLEVAITNKPQDVTLYKELGFAFALIKDLKGAVDSYQKGIDKCNDKQTELKSELAFNIGMTYKNAGYPDEYKTWMLKAKEIAAPNSNIYKSIVSQGF